MGFGKLLLRKSSGYLVSCLFAFLIKLFAGNARQFKPHIGRNRIGGPATTFPIDTAKPELRDRKSLSSGLTIRGKKSLIVGREILLKLRIRVRILG